MRSISLTEDSRATFITRTYAHLLGAIVAFTLLEVVFFKTGLAAALAPVLGGNWLIVLGAFMIVSWLASRFAFKAEALSTQYMCLIGFVVMESIIFIPMLYMAEAMAGPAIIADAGIITLLGFGGLTAIVFVTRKDFTFMGGLLKWIGLVAIAAVVGSLIFNFELGTWFSIAMIAFAGAAILYDTSNVLHNFPEDRYVGAALELFASVALMLWYVLRLLMSTRD